MGGAFTALADDGAGPYYNPAGIAFATQSSLSLFVSAYALNTGSFDNALGDGHDFTFRTLDTFPVSTSVVYLFGDHEPGEPPPHALALSAFVPDAVRIDDRDTLGSVDNAFFFTYQTRTVWAGATYAHRLGRFSIGVGGFLLLGDTITTFDITSTAATATHVPFETITARTDITQLGVVATAGVRWDPTDHLHLGLSLYTPEVGGGERRLFARGTVDSGEPGGAGAMVINADNLHATPNEPLRIQTGIAWSSGGWTLAGDVMLLGPRVVDDDPETADQGLERRIVRHAVVDGSLGVERVVASSFPIRAGVFTDFASDPDPVAQPGNIGVDLPSSQHVDHYGVTTSVGYRTSHTATNFGLILDYGTGHGLTPDNLDFTMLVPQPTHRLAAYLLASSSYEF
jgi:long-chain fatty acid transport protein